MAATQLLDPSWRARAWFQTRRAAPAPEARTLHNVQLLRALAAYLVVLFHMPISKTADGGHAVDFFAFGVDIFFVISGFVMVYATHLTPRTPGLFLRDRIIRIAPLYWIATAVTLALFWIGYRPAGVHAVDMDDVLSTLLFLPDVRADGLYSPVLTVGWTLNYEMAFYALFAAAMLLGRQKASLIAVAAALIAASAFGVLVEPENVVLAAYTNPIMLEFLLGVGLGYAFLRMDAAPRWAAPVALAALAIAALCVGLVEAYDVEILEAAQWRRAFFYGAPACLIVAATLLLERAGYIARSRFWRLQGAASYAVYLFHMLTLQPSVKAIDALGLDAIAPRFLIDLAPLAVAGLFGVAIHLWLEQPLTRAIKRRAARA